MKHAHADLLHRLADDCELAVWYWASYGPFWVIASHEAIVFDDNGANHYALGDKPTAPPKRYAMVEGVRVPMTHLTVAPKSGTYWFIQSNDFVQNDIWLADSWDTGRFAINNCYATEADAIEAAAAWAQVRKNAAERAGIKMTPGVKNG